ncbi:MAG: phosphohistidine phosphatase SixA [Microscillaceae bacterium]
MSKQLCLIRHAKAKEIKPEQVDFDRKLAKRGRADAEAMAQQLLPLGLKPTLIYSSPAERTRETAEIFAQVLGYAPEKIVHVPEVYEANLQTLLEVVNKMSDEADTALLVGHNPGLTVLADYLSPTEVAFLPTTGMALFEFEVDSWSEISGSTGTLLWLKNPKMF